MYCSFRPMNGSGIRSAASRSVWTHPGTWAGTAVPSWSRLHPSLSWAVAFIGRLQSDGRGPGSYETSANLTPGSLTGLVLVQAHGLTQRPWWGAYTRHNAQYLGNDWVSRRKSGLYRF